MTDPGHGDAEIRTEGQLIRWAAGYDVLLGAVTLGFEKRFRRRIVAAAGLRPGQRVLDVGCGTGTLALVAAAAVGPEGRVEGIDPSPQMIARARAKAAARGSAARFQVAAIEKLPFADQSFDAVLSSLMFHHLPGPLKQTGLAELHRVLAPGGSLTIVDFDDGGPVLHRLAAHLSPHAHGASHANSGIAALALEARRAGFQQVATSRFRPRFLHRLSAVAAREG